MENPMGPRGTTRNNAKQNEANFRPFGFKRGWGVGVIQKLVHFSQKEVYLHHRSMHLRSPISSSPRKHEFEGVRPRNPTGISICYVVLLLLYTEYRTTTEIVLHVRSSNRSETFVAKTCNPGCRKRESYTNSSSLLSWSSSQHARDGRGRKRFFLQDYLNEEPVLVAGHVLNSGHVGGLLGRCRDRVHSVILHQDLFFFRQKKGQGDDDKPLFYFTKNDIEKTLRCEIEGFSSNIA